MVSNTEFQDGHSDKQYWGALTKAWKAYKICRRQGDTEEMGVYARRIQSLQKKLGLEVSVF